MPSILVVTGGPCAGKTTLITRLGDLGHPVIPEAAAEVILEGRHPSREPVAFQREVLRRQLQKEAAAGEGLIFADRAVGDHFGYLEYYRTHCGLDLAGNEFLRELDLAWESSRGNYRAVFLLEQNPEFVPSNYRRENSLEARRIHQALRAAYATRHPRVIEVGWAPVEDRVRAVLGAVEDLRQAR
jgi:predicted ATPase